MMDSGEVIYLYVGKNIDPTLLQALLGPSDYSAMPEQMVCFATNTHILCPLYYFFFLNRSMNYPSWRHKNLNGYGVSINTCKIRNLNLLFYS